MTVARRVAVIAVVVIGAAIAGSIVVGAGQDKLVICSTASGLDGFAARMSAGHTDGPTATYCNVPSESSWIVGGLVFVAVLLLAGAIVIGLHKWRQRPT